MAKKKRSYKETKALVKEKAGLKRQINQQIQDTALKQELNRSVSSASYKTINSINDKLKDKFKQLKITSSFYNDTAENMRQWAVVKKYNEMVDDGIIKPPNWFSNYYDQYDYMVEQVLTVDDLEELIGIANAQEQKRIERLAHEQDKDIARNLAILEEFNAIFE